MSGARRTYRLTLLASAFAALAFGVWLSTDIGTVDVRTTVSDVVFVVAPLAAAWSCWSADRRRAARHRAWAWLGAGCLTWSMGSIAWVSDKLVLHRAPAFPSLADVGYLGYAIPVVIGLMAFPGSVANVWSRVRVWLDGAVIALSLLITSAIWVLTPVLGGTNGLSLSRMVALAYPLVDLTVASIVLARCIVLPNSRRGVWMALGAGLLVETAADSTYVARSFGGGYTPGHLLDLGWLVSFLLIAIAAQTPVPGVENDAVPAPETGDPPSLLQQLLPYGPMCIAGVAISRSPAFQWHGRYLIATLSLAAFIAVRQAVVAGDHVSLTRDLATAVRRRTAELSGREQWWREIVQNLSDVVIVIDRAGQVSYCSPSIENVLGHWPRHLDDRERLRTQIHPADLQATIAALAPVLDGSQRRAFVECRILRVDDKFGWFEVTAVGQLSDGVLEGAVLTLHDVTERRRLTDQLSHQAFHDELTGLPNRVLLMERIDQRLRRANRRPFALLLVDLDDFKLINDSHGHGAGDVVLEAIGRRLSRAVRPGDVVARLGGDEFAVLTTGPADVVANRLRDAIEEPVVANGRRFHVHASIGVVPADADETAHSLLSHADIALYEAKARDKGGVVVIEGAERQAAADQVRLREQIAHPNLDEFYLAYQPVVDVASGTIRGIEALMRWRHPELGEISPAEFIGYAEHGGSIQTLGWHALKTACADLAAWHREFPHHRLAVGVNVSILQLDEPDFAESVRDLIASHGLSPDQVVLEITEQSLARDFETAVAVVTALREHGVSVAVDDFGTGYSSLRYLHRFAADVVKIDRGFISHLGDSDHTRKLVRSVIQMAESLDLQSIAEGIETSAQLAIVRDLGFELAQGYLFSRPVGAGAITSLMRVGGRFDLAGAGARATPIPAIA